jgi:autophagy-related protein 18
MFVGFSQNGNRLSTASMGGFQQFDISPTSFKRLHNETSLGGISIAAVEEASSTLVACLANPNSHLANRVVVLFDMKEHQPITEMHFEDPILAIRVNPSRLVIIMERRTHLFNFRTLAPLPQISTTSPPNVKGLGTLSSCERFNEVSYFAWAHTEMPSSRGDAVVMDVQSMKIMMIPAHQTSPIAQLELSRSGTRLATCSTKGTVIRVYSIPQGELLYSLRRGSKDAIIDGLVFSPAGTMLAVTSNSTTLHIFKCDKLSVSERDDIRSFAKITVKDGVKYLMGLSGGDDTLYLVAKPNGTEAMMDVYSIPRGGGEARKTGDFRLN